MPERERPCTTVKLPVITVLPSAMVQLLITVLLVLEKVESTWSKAPSEWNRAHRNWLGTPITENPPVKMNRSSGSTLTEESDEAMTGVNEVSSVPSGSKRAMRLTDMPLYAVKVPIAMMRPSDWMSMSSTWPLNPVPVVKEAS